MWWTHKPSVSRASPSRECFIFALVLEHTSFPFSRVVWQILVVNTQAFMSKVSSGAWGKCASFLVSRVLIKLALVVTHKLVFSKGYKQALVNKWKMSSVLLK